MLQSALASSEARAAQLDEELARKPVSKDKLENQVSVLSHRLESVEEECARWRREAEQLDEVVANERVKFDALKRKLEIAESGPDKLTKKEINYWRANAEKIDEQIHAYKARIGALKRELREKDQLLESGSPALVSFDVETNEAEGPNDVAFSEAEIENLRQQIASLNAVLTESHASREALESELADLQTRFEQANVASTAPETTDSSLTIDLDRAQQENARLRSSLQLSEAELHELRHARAELSNEIAALKRQLENDRQSSTEHERQQQLLSAQLEEVRVREACLQSELESMRQELANREQQLPVGAVSGEVAEALKAEIASARQEAADLRTALAQSTDELAELRDAREGLAAELAELQQRIEAEKAQAAGQTQREHAVAEELQAARHRETELRAELDNRERDSQGYQETTQALHDAVATAERKATEAAAHIDELKAELKEEKEYSENLSELANSRQDQVTKLQDGIEEARERLEDALWRLEKAKYFERLVARRKVLIASLLEGLRGKNKAMVALKAGLDSLRTHKATAEETQQKLLIRLDNLTKELGATRERMKAIEAEASAAKQQSTEADAGDVAAIQERLATQAELIQSLENEIKTAKAFKRNAEEKDGEVSQLHEELETKNSIIARLQADLDEQQRKLAKLRGSDSETMRLKAVSEKDRSTIDVLERENAELRAMIESSDQARSENGVMTDDRELELQAKIAELTEAVGKWKKKYDFLATEAPAAYQTQAAAKQ